MGRLLVMTMVAGAAVVAVKNLPDIKRYLKMRSM